MCSDATNNEYEGFTVKNEVGCSWEGEATTSESRLHLSDIWEMLIRLDQQEVFMNPVDDSIAPDYSKVIKNPMCFLKMREKIHTEQYTSWVSFVEDFECICHNAMKYNQKRSKIWNAANSLLRQGKRFLEQQSSRYRKILGIRKVHNGTTYQQEVSAKLRLDQSCQGTRLDALSRSLDKPNCHTSDNLVTNSCEKQGPITTGRNLTVNEMITKEEPAISFANEHFVKGSDKDVNVEIFTTEPEEDGRLDLEDQATECSSSFSSTQSELEGDSCEDESEFRNGNGASVPAGESSVTSRRRKRAMDPDWKTYRQGIEWRCRWLELRIQDLHAKANKYEKVLEAARIRKERHHQDGSVARTSTRDHNHRTHILGRRQRRRVEESADFMSKHPLFSRYGLGKKKHRYEELSSTEEAARIDEQQQMEFDDFDFENEYEDNIFMEKDSMEHYLWQIEALQMQIYELKNQLIRGSPLEENIADVEVENHRYLPITVFGSPRFSGASTQLHSPSSPAVRSVTRGSKGHGGTPSRRRNSDFDINNVVMPDTVMANYVEPPRHAFITTPRWRQREDIPAQDEKGSSDENTDDEIYEARHAQMQMRERQQQYTPLPLNKSRNLSTAKERPKIDMARRGSVEYATVAEEWENYETTFPTSFGYVPRRKRRRRRTREVAATANESQTSPNVSQTERKKVCTRSTSIKNT